MRGKELVNIDVLNRDYNSIKEEALKQFEQNEYETALKLIETAARIAYQYNFIPSFADDQLDNMLADISKIYCTIVPHAECIENRIVFYDFLALNSRGLTQQYLRSLIELDYEILYVVPNDLSLNENNDIFKQIKNYSKGRLLVLSNNLSNKEKAQKILHIIKLYRPSKAFLHLSPWDVVASLVFIPLAGIVHRYFINLTDHAFWLCKNIIDTSLEFRNFGYQLSKHCRNIDESKLALLPYYPILQSEDKYQGLPDAVIGKIIGVSGGAGYKYVGGQGKFYSLISQLLKKQPDFVFILVGVGITAKHFEEKIKKDNLQDRFLLLPDRPDIFQVIKHCDIYFSSYPFMGALMIQLAAKAGLPIVAFYNEKEHINKTEELLLNYKPGYKTIESEQVFLDISSKLITDGIFREQYAHLTANSIISELEFTESLNSVLKGNCNTYDRHKQELAFIKDTSNDLSKIFIEIENYFTPKYHKIISLYLDKYHIGLLDAHIRNRIKEISKRKEKSIVSYIKKVVRHLKRRLWKLLNKRKGKEEDKDKPFIFVRFKNQLGKLVPPYRIINSNYMTIGDNFFSSSNLCLEAIDSYEGQRFLPELIIGNNVKMNTDCHIVCINKVIIGNNVLFASKIYISDHSHGEINSGEFSLKPAERLLYTKGPVIIEDNVWVGEGVSILSGVTIGENSIIGANAVVTKNVPSNSVAGGIPARVIKSLC